MRKSIFVFVMITLIEIVGFADLSSAKPKALKEGIILSVGDIHADPSAYKGMITVTGVVANKSRTNSKVFAIVDTSEAKTCKTTGCSKFYLPVSYEGEIPKEWDEVNITGTIVKGVLVATKLDILRHLTL